MNKRGRPRKMPDLFQEAEIVRLHGELRLTKRIGRIAAIAQVAKTLGTHATHVRSVLAEWQPGNCDTVFSVRKIGNTFSIAFCPRPNFRKSKASQVGRIIERYDSLTLPAHARAAFVARALGITSRRVRQVVAERS